MDIKNELKTGVKLAADAATDIAQALVEKSRLRAKANRIKQVIKADTELRNQAYIELGRYYYENLRDSSNEECEALCVVIDKTSKRIDKAGIRYVELMSDSSDVKFKSENTEKIKKIMTDTAQDIKGKAKETGKIAKSKAADLGGKAKIKAQDLSVKAKETVADFTDRAKDKVDDFRSFIGPDEDIEDIIVEIEEDINNDTPHDDIKADIKKTEVKPVEPEVTVTEPQTEIKAEIPTPVIDVYEEEESPEEFEF